MGERGQRVLACNLKKSNRTPQQANMPLLAVPYRPSWVEHLILSNRNILADQMEFLVNHLPRDRRHLLALTQPIPGAPVMLARPTTGWASVPHVVVQPVAPRRYVVSPASLARACVPRSASHPCPGPAAGPTIRE